jgi:hypothetical protein
MIRDPDLADLLRAELPSLSDELIAAIGQEVEAYSRPIEGQFGRNVRVGVEEALERFADLLAGGPAARPEGWERVYVDLGRGEMRDGRSLDALQAAYRVGARVAWRRLAAIAEGAGLARTRQAELAEAIFAYIDELAAASVEGFAAEQAARAGEAQRRRARLVQLLVADPPADPAAIGEAAEAAASPLPERAAAIAVAEPRAERVAGRLGQGTLAAQMDDELTCAIVPDPEGPGRRREMAAALDGRAAAIGPARPWHELGSSFARARALLALGSAGAVPPRWPMRADEHLIELLLSGDRQLAEDLARRALAPLERFGETTRERFADTLLAWLDQPGRPTAVARELHVHPQTVHYRIGRLREAFGDDALDNPERRFGLAAALRARRLLDHASADASDPEPG